MFVCLFDGNLSRALNFHLRAVWVSLRSVLGLSQVCLRSVSSLEALFPYFVVQSEPKILLLGVRKITRKEKIIYTDPCQQEHIKCDSPLSIHSLILSGGRCGPWH